MIITGTTTTEVTTSRCVCCVVEGTKHYLSHVDLAKVSKQLYQIVEFAPPAKPLRIVLPQWVKTKEFLYSISYIRREPAPQQAMDYDFGLRVLRLAQFFGNASLQRHSMLDIMLARVSPATLPQAVGDSLRLIKTATGETRSLAEQLLRGCIAALGKHMLQLNDSSAQLTTLDKVKKEAGEELGEIVDEAFEAAYGAAVSGYEEEKLLELIKAHIKAAGESSIVGLFTKKLKAMLERALKSVKAGNSPEEVVWNARGDAKAESQSGTIDKGGEEWHLVLRRDQRTGKYQVLLAKGPGQDEKPAARRPTPNERSCSTISSRKATAVTRGMFSAHLGLRLGKMSLQSRSVSYNGTLRNPMSEVSSRVASSTRHIQLSAEASSAISLNTSAQGRASAGEIVCMVSYIELGEKDAEARMNIHYINTQDKRLVIKERTAKELARKERTISVRASLFHSFAVSVLLERIVSGFGQIATDKSMGSLSHHQLLFIVNNARKNGATEDSVCDSVWTWAEQNVNKCPLERISALAKRVNWGMVSREKLDLLAAQPLFAKLGLSRPKDVSAGNRRSSLFLQAMVGGGGSRRGSSAGKKAKVCAGGSGSKLGYSAIRN